MDVTKNARLRELLSKQVWLLRRDVMTVVGAELFKSSDLKWRIWAENGTMGSLLGKPDIRVGTATKW
jgi:hypothetical protein